MKKIAIVIQDLKGNGAERVMITLAKGFSEQGHECHIFNFRDKVELPVPKHIQRHFFPLKKFRILPRFIRHRIVSLFLDRFITQRMGRPDLVLSNLMNVDRIMRFSSHRVFTVLHNTISSEHLIGLSSKEKANKLTFLSKIYTAHPCIAVSSGVEADYRAIFNNHNGIRTIHNPIDLQLIKQEAKQPAPNSLPNEYLLHVGKFNKAKRQDKLLQAYALSSVTTPLVLVGQGPLLEQTKQLAAKLNIEDHVIFAGFHSNPYPIIQKAKCFILSSDFEGLGMVILEALALNTPAISTDCPSGPNEILPPQNLCPVNDINALASLIKKADAKPSLFNVPLQSKFSLNYATQQYLKGQIQSSKE